MKSVLSLLLLVGMTGCRSMSTEYDLSTTAPFYAYSNRTVELRKPMIVLKDHQGQYELHGINPEDLQTGIVLPTGYKVTVLNTCLDYHKQSWISGGFQNGRIRTYLSVDLDRQGWPRTVRTFVEPCRVTSERSTGRIEIKVSPWEPLDTPLKRSIPWPSETLIVCPYKD
jgi:hypothetical protein